MNILSKILDHENEIFEKYQNKRTMLRNSLQNVSTASLTQDQVLVLIHDLKAILDPIKMSIHSIDHYLSNTTFTKKDSLIEQSETELFLYLLLNIRFGSFSSLESLETDTLSSELSEESDTSETELSESELSSSK
jgi:hypothetical protein